MKFLKNDKVQHFIVGVVGTLPIFFVSYEYSNLLWIMALGSFGLIYGVTKEVYDYFHPKKHCVEFLDLAATWGGAAPVLWIYLLLNI